MHKNMRQTILTKFLTIYDNFKWYGFAIGLILLLFLLSFSKNQPMLPNDFMKESDKLNVLQKSKELPEKDILLKPQNREYELTNDLKVSDIVTILLIGIDNRPGEDYISNTDTLILANINKSKNQIAFLSIPRDTQVGYREHGTSKINNVARLGGSYIELVKVLEYILDKKIDGYIISDFNGFKKTIDTLGGITINVEKDMYFDTGDKTDGIINLKKGVQRLNGTQALQYARFRNDALADISRTVRQQNVLKSLASEVIKLKNIAKLPKIIPDLYQSVSTNLSALEILSLSKSLIRFEEFKIVSQTLPGKFVIENEISYWKVNNEEIKLTAENLFDQGKTSSIFSGLVKETSNSSTIKKTKDMLEQDIFDQGNKNIEIEITFPKNKVETETEAEAKQEVIFEVLGTSN